ncbi:Serine/threonine-protein phosphatase 7 long form-like protein, partial [Mucuna pruriens]
MDESVLSIMEVREDFMVSPTGDSEPALRTAYFLKPLAKSLDGAVSEVLSSFVSMPLPAMFEPKEWPLAVHFKGWSYPKEKWVEWVDALQLRYGSVWKKVGIFEAIMSTKCFIVKDQNLCCGVAEKWCPETNTFLFPWGEATVTLEDVMVLGGYPVVGNPVFTTLQSQEMREVEEKLIHARQEPWRRKKGKASTSAWMDLFVNSRSEIEHEAFLATWLTMVGFSPNGLVSKFVFPIAVHLARGNPIALGPAVLATIYKDLTLLKKTIVGLTEKQVLDDKLKLEVTLQSPFNLVQIWVWERFKNLQPKPRLINHDDPMLFRWHKVNALKIDNVRLALDSAMEHFRWRPYVQYAGKFKVFYPENETLVPVEADLDNELVSYVTCLRVSVLVGIQSTIKRYLPHRVAMQFGMDQDVPGCVPKFYGTKSIAWKNYCRPLSDRDLYFPARLFEGDVTTRYAKWWKESVQVSHQDFAMNVVRQKRSSRPATHHGSRVSKANTNGNDADVPPGFSPKLGSTVYFRQFGGDDSNAGEGNSGAGIPSGFLLKRLKTVGSGSFIEDGSKDGLKDDENIDADVPTRYKNLSNQSSVASTADYENVQRIPSGTKLVAKDIVEVEPWMRGLEEDFEDANVRNESRVSSESYICASGIKVMDLEQRINRLETMIKKLKILKFGQS